MIREQEAIGKLHLVGVGSLRHRDLSQDVRPARIGDVHDARPYAEVAHVADVENVAVPHDLHPVATTLEVGMADELEAALFQRARRCGHRAGFCPV